MSEVSRTGSTRKKTAKKATKKTASRKATAKKTAAKKTETKKTAAKKKTETKKAATKKEEKPKTEEAEEDGAGEEKTAFPAHKKPGGSNEAHQGNQGQCRDPDAQGGVRLLRVRALHRAGERAPAAHRPHGTPLPSRPRS